MSFRQTSANAFQSASPQFFVRELQSSQLGLSPEPSPVFSWAVPAALAASAQAKEPPAPPISAIHSHRHAQQLALVLKDILQMQASPSHCPHDQLSQPAPGSLNEFNPSFSQVQFEDYVKELIPALHLVNRAGGLNLAQRQEAIKFAADAVLARRGVGMGWSHALNNRLAISATNFASSEEEETEFAGQDTVEGGCSSLDEICTLNDDSSCKATSCPEVDDAFEHPDLLAGALTVILPTGRSSEVDDTTETSGVLQLSMVDSTSELVDDEGVCNSHEQNVSQSPLASISIKNSNASVMMPLPGALLSGTSSPPAPVDSVVTPESGSTAKDSHIKMLIGAEFVHPQELPGSLDGSVSSNPPDQKAVSAADMELGVSVLGHGGNDGVTIDFHDEETVRGDDQNVVRAGMACDKAGEVAGIPYFCAPGMFSVPSGALFATPATGAVPQEAAYCSSLEKTNMREMIYRVAALQPIDIGREAISRPKRRNVRISKDPQSVAARHRRERISDRIRILQRLVPGGTKMDTASMLDEAIHYVKFLKMQVQALDRLGRSLDYGGGTSWTPFLHCSSSSGYMGCANLYASSDVYQSGVTQAAAGGEKGCSSSSPPCLGASRVDQLQQQSCH